MFRSSAQKLTSMLSFAMSAFVLWLLYSRRTLGRPPKRNESHGLFAYQPVSRRRLGSRNFRLRVIVSGPLARVRTAVSASFQPLVKRFTLKMFLMLLFLSQSHIPDSAKPDLSSARPSF